MVGYLFQGWNCRGPAKYRDMLMDTATEEIGHVEMIATMIARLLETSPVEAEQAANGGGVVGAVLGGNNTQKAILAGMNPQHAIVTGLGAAPRDSMGNPWNANYIVSSGNLLADMRSNVTAESQGRLQVARLYQLTQDAGVRDMFSFLLARDTMYQNQWLAAIEELKADGLEETPVPSNFPQEREMSEVAYRFINFSEGGERAGPLGERAVRRRQGRDRVRGRAPGDGSADGRAGPAGRATSVLDLQTADASGLLVSERNAAI
jgi:Mn-containing catalase